MKLRTVILPACWLIFTGCGLNSANAQLAPAAEVTSKETPFTFKSGVNMVPVSVVVRDSKGHAVGNLSLEDFQLFDNNKLQSISKFSVEKITDDQPEPDKAQPAKPTTPTAGLSPAPAPQPATEDIPDRFIAYFFDDLHLSLQDLVSTREAAKKQLTKSLQPFTRAAIYTATGHQMLEFTGDRDKLNATLDSIGAGAATASRALTENTCPPVDYYMGDRIFNKRDLTVWKIATKDALACGNLGATDVESLAAVQEGTVSACEISGNTDGVCKAVKLAHEAAHSALLAGDRDTEASLQMLRSIVTRMSAMPGQRSVVVISPGFLVLDDLRDEQMSLIDRAIKSKVIIGGLDARGLYSQIQGGDASSRTPVGSMIDKVTYQATETLMQTDVIATLADGTGGTFFTGNNDYDEAFTRVAAPPEYVYVLGFSPADLKLDGKFHTLKVTLRSSRGLELQVRKGYYAPKSSTDPADQAKQDIEEAFFSRSEVHDLPAILQTQYFMGDNGEATLSAVAKVDVKKLTFHRDGDRNRNDLTVITGLFDNDGNFISGAQKVIQMRLLDDTLQKRLSNGISVNNSFSVHPGRYVVRLVVRDSEGQLMSAQSSLVDVH